MEPDREVMPSTESIRRELDRGTLWSWAVEAAAMHFRINGYRKQSGSQAVPWHALSAERGAERSENGSVQCGWYRG